MSTFIKQPKQTEGTPFFHKILFSLLAVVILVLFLKPDYGNVCGLVLVALFICLFLAGYHEFVFAVIITANDALGTMFMGKVSFQYLLLALAIFKILQHLSLSKRSWAFLLTSVYFLLQLLWVDTLPDKRFLNALSYVVAIAAMMLDTNKEALARFFKGVAVTIVLISIHAMLTGGVEFYESYGNLNDANEHALRRGVLGASDGNPNHSAFLLNIGIIALWSFSSWNVVIKSLCSIPILYAFVLTNSMSGLLALLLIVALAILLQQDRNSKNGKRIFIACLAVILLIGLFFIYTNLPSSMRFEQLDNFLSRIENKLDFAQDGDWDSLTTNRSDLAIRYLRYIFTRQDVFGLLVGGNPLVVPSVSSAIAHNNFIGVLLQVGVVGTLIFLAAIVKRVFFVWKQPDIPYRKGRLLLKCFCLFAAFGISLYGSSLWAFWMMILLLL